MPNYFSLKGIREFNGKIREMETTLNKLKAETNPTAQQSGDRWHDNPGFYTLMTDMRMATESLKRDYAIRRYMEVVDYPSNPEHVCLGCTVLAEENLERRVFHIAGFGESDPKNDIIAYNTPLAKGMIMKKPDEIVRIATEKGSPRLIKILEVRPYEGPT